MADQQPDYDALAQKHGGAVDYDGLAAKYGANGSVQPDAFQKAVNFHTGNALIDAPLGVIQGAAKGAASLGEDIGALTRYALGKPQASPEEVALDTKPDGIGQGTGKFLEQTAEYAVPAGEVAKATKGAGLVARTLAQAGVGAGVSAEQTHGDPVATAAGGVLGAAGELVPAAISGVKRLATERAPNIQNFSDAFGAVPTQKPAITKALPTLLKDGVTPAGSLPDMQDAVKGKLQDLGQAYQALPQDIGSRTIDPQKVIAALKQQQAPFQRGSVVSSANKQYVDKIGAEIQDVYDLAKQNGGKLTFDDLRYMRDGANGRTNWTSPEADQNLYKSLGNVYRSAMDQIAPETTQLNRDYATYKSLESIADKNANMGRGGVTRSGLQTVMDKATASTTGAAVGGTIGHAIAGGPGAAMGATAGAVLWPKLAAPARQALQNAMDSGAFDKLSPLTRATLQRAASIGDSVTVQKFLQRVPVTGVQSLTEGR